MLIRPIACVVNYVTTLNESLKKISSKKLTKSQRVWLTIVLMGLIVTGSFNWAAFERRTKSLIEQTSYWSGFRKNGAKRIASISKGSLIYTVINCNG